MNMPVTSATARMETATVEGKENSAAPTGTSCLYSTPDGAQTCLVALQKLAHVIYRFF